MVLYGELRSPAGRHTDDLPGAGGPWRAARHPGAEPRAGTAFGQRPLRPERRPGGRSSRRGRAVGLWR